ncbi:MAG: hypothetical protein ACKKL6_01965 [Candidatus Komeilibacteria bacterium]
MNGIQRVNIWLFLFTVGVIVQGMFSSAIIDEPERVTLITSLVVFAMMKGTFTGLVTYKKLHEMIPTPSLLGFITGGIFVYIISPATTTIKMSTFPEVLIPIAGFTISYISTYMLVKLIAKRTVANIDE